MQISQFSRGVGTWRIPAALSINGHVLLEEDPDGKGLYFMSGSTATLSTIVHKKCFCCILEQQCSTNFLVSVDFKRSECLRHLFSTLTEQSNSQDAFLGMLIVHARMSALSLPTENVSPGACEQFSARQERPCNARCFSCTLQSPALPCGISTHTLFFRFPILRGFNLSFSKRRC